MKKCTKKECLYCGESILETAKKCKHCGERLEEKEGRNLTKKESSGRFIISFFRFILFIIITFVFSYISLFLVGLLLGLFAMLNPFWLIVGIILFSGLFFSIRSFLIAGLAYLINQIFKIPINKKVARIFFRIIFILVCIDKIVGLWIIETGASTIFNIFYTLIIIFIGVTFTIELKNFTEEDF